MLKITGTTRKIKVVDSKVPNDGVHRANENGRLKHPKIMMLDDKPLFYGNESFFRKLDEERGLKIYYSFNTGISMPRLFVEKIISKMKRLDGFSVPTFDIVSVEVDVVYKGERINKNAFAIEVKNIAGPVDAWKRYCEGRPYNWGACNHPDHSPEGFKRFIKELEPHIKDSKSVTLGSIMWSTRSNRWYLIDCALTKEDIKEVKENMSKQDSPRKIYIDCGAFIGDSIKAFLNMTKDSNEYEVYAFEPNPFSKVHKKYGHLYDVYCAATWIEDGELPFYIKEFGKEHQGGSLLKEKISGGLDKKHPIMVKSIDFGKWIKDNFKPEDYIVVKMDIEGAEFKVLPNMIKDGSINYVNRLYLETHENRIGLGPDDFNALMKSLSTTKGLELWKSFSEIMKHKLLVRGVPSRPTIESESARLRFYRKLDFLPKDFKWKLITNEFKGDVLYVQKRAEQIPLIESARSIGMPVVYDSDDGDGVRRKGDDRPVFQLVDAITTDSEERAEAFRKHTQTPVYVVHDGIDYITEQPEPQRISGAIKRICSFGSDRTTNATIDYLLALVGQYDVSYITKSKVDKLKKCKYIRWDYNTFINNLIKHDLCILVHGDTDEKAYKGNARLITAMSVGIPTICSNTPSYVTAMKDCGYENFIISNPSELPEKIKLLEDKDTRRDMQAKFMDYAWKNYDPIKMAENLATIFRKVIDAKNTNLQQ